MLAEQVWHVGLESRSPNALLMLFWYLVFVSPCQVRCKSWYKKTSSASQGRTFRSASVAGLFPRLLLSCRGLARYHMICRAGLRKYVSVDTEDLYFCLSARFASFSLPAFCSKQYISPRSCSTLVSFRSLSVRRLSSARAFFMCSAFCISNVVFGSSPCRAIRATLAARIGVSRRVRRLCRWSLAICNHIMPYRYGCLYNVCESREESKTCAKKAENITSTNCW